jgi:hypothetical protein
LRIKIFLHLQAECCDLPIPDNVRNGLSGEEGWLRALSTRRQGGCGVTDGAFFATLIFSIDLAVDEVLAVLVVFVGIAPLQLIVSPGRAMAR